jgi:hypothetical protein
VPDQGVLGAYEARSRTIYLRDDWNSRNASDVSVLVHELVHYLQDRAALHFDCSALREEIAYNAQQRWLQLLSTDLQTEFGIDQMTLKLETACLPY